MKTFKEFIVEEEKRSLTCPECGSTMGVEFKPLITKDKDRPSVSTIAKCPSCDFTKNITKKKSKHTAGITY